MSEVITFYSYKGGVGRTMALANVSIVLSTWGHKVLVVDWDLEAPGLEHFYKDYIEDIKVVETKSGVIDFLQADENNNWQDDIISINIPQSNMPIHFISSGKRDERYFKKMRSFDVDEFYENNGGDIIEKLRNEWLENYDYVLIDSRTGITEIGGICTIQLPDTVVMLFTATNQGFDGVLDIINRASTAQQKLSYDRQKLIFLPIPSKFETNTEFKLSQKWLEIFAERLENTYNDWLPIIVNRKDFLELSKIPYIAYFSFGEKLPVIEQGVKDPSGLGYAYETLAALIANNLNNVDLLFNNRDQYIAGVNKYPSLETEVKRNGNGNNAAKKLNLLKNKLNIGNENIKLEKSEEVILQCIQNSILPLLESVSIEMKKIGSIFKNKNENIEIIGEYTNNNDFQEKRYAYEATSALINLMGNIKSLYSNNVSVKDFELNTLIYSCNFRDLRKSKNINIEVDLTLVILFHKTVFEIKSNVESVNIDKLYHENISPEESETITEEFDAYLLEKIEDILPNVTSIKYLSWLNDKWEASFKPLPCHWQKVKDKEILSVSDPQFEHKSNETHNTHQDSIINYLSANGEEWTAICHAHLSDDIVSFTFEHKNKITNKSHPSPNIRFLDWDKKLWNATIEPMKVSKNSDKTISFTRHLV